MNDSKQQSFATTTVPSRQKLIETGVVNHKLNYRACPKTIARYPEVALATANNDKQREMFVAKRRANAATKKELVVEQSVLAMETV